MRCIAIYSETGGVTKTTTAVALAVEAARQGHRVVLIDLDPRATTTKWLSITPTQPGLHVGALLAAEDPTGWAHDMAVPAKHFAPRLRVIPSHRELTLREKQAADFSELRLAMALDGLDADLVIIDCPNRQGGPLTLSALNAATDLVIAARPDEDGLDGIEGALGALTRFRRSRAVIGATSAARFAGIIIGAVPDPILTRDARTAIDTINRQWPDLTLGLIPARVIVREARAAGSYFADFDRGHIVAAAYRAALANLITTNTKENT